MPLVTPQPIPGSNNTRWEVVIMDSTAGGHGPDDTRKPDDPLSERNAPILTTSGQVQPSGLGIGTIALDTTPSGDVTGVEWNVGDPPEPIVFGAGHPLDDPRPTRPRPGPLPDPASYDLAAANGVVSSFGAAYNYGPTTPLTLAAPVVGLATTTDGNGYWEASATAGSSPIGSAPFRGSMAGTPIARPVDRHRRDRGRGRLLAQRLRRRGLRLRVRRLPGSMGGTAPQRSRWWGSRRCRTARATGWWLRRRRIRLRRRRLLRLDGRQVPQRSDRGDHADQRRQGLLAGGGRRRGLRLRRRRLLRLDGRAVTSHAPVVSWARPTTAAGTGSSPPTAGVFAYGDATFAGSATGRSSSPVVGGAAA